VTADPAAADCDPLWTDDDALVLLHGLIPPQHWDLRGQGVTAWQIHTMTELQPPEEYL
jgi:hypothetical protein